MWGIVLPRFWIAVSDGEWCLSFCALAGSLSSLKNVYSGLLPILFKLYCLFFDVELYEYDIYKYILCVLTWIGHIIYEYLLPFSRQPFCFVHSFLHCTEVFQFGVELFVIFVLASLAWWYISKKNILRSMSKGILPGTSLVVQRLKLCTSNAGRPGSVPGQRTRSHKPQLNSLHAAM